MGTTVSRAYKAWGASVHRKTQREYDNAFTFVGHNHLRVEASWCTSLQAASREL